MRPSHIFAGFGCFFLGYSHGVSPFSGDARSRATALFIGYFKIFQSAERKRDRLFAAGAAGCVQINAAHMTQAFALFTAERL